MQAHHGTPAEDDDRHDALVLGLLLDPDAQRPWAVEEVAREVGDDVAARDAIARLHASGLLHRLDGFVFASRAAQRGARLAL